MGRTLGHSRGLDKSLILADIKGSKGGPTVSAMPRVAAEAAMMNRDAKILEATQMKNRSRVVNEGLRNPANPLPYQGRLGQPSVLESRISLLKGGQTSVPKQADSVAKKSAPTGTLSGLLNQNVLHTLNMTAASLNQTNKLIG